MKIFQNEPAPTRTAESILAGFGAVPAALTPTCPGKSGG